MDQDFEKNALFVERVKKTWAERKKKKEGGGKSEGKSGRENRRIKYPPYFHGTLP